jgi:hypothetical protein
MADLRVDIASEFTGKKAFKEASNATGSLDKAVGKLGKQLAAVFATTKIIAFGKASVKAFIEDERAATKLTTAVKNLGLSFAQTQIDSFISKLESTSRVADDLLRPAFQALLTTTGSLTKSQELLNLAIETSRGSGIALQTVTQDLANAYVGNTRGLRKYNLGLSVAALKAASFEEVQARLNKQFTGASASYLTTYAGKFEALQLAAGNAQETIGKGLVDAIALIGGKGVSDIQNATDAMDDFANSTANVIRGQGVVIANLGKLGGGTGGKIGNLVKTYFKEVLGIQALEDLGKASQPRPRRGIVSRGNANNVTILTKAEKDAAKNAKELAALTKKNTDELKKQTALKKAGTVFDLEQIQIIAALKGKLSEEDKIRLQAQLAILNENEALASSLTKQILMAQDSTGGLYKFFLAIGDMKIANPFAFLDQWIIEFQKKLNALTFPNFDPNAPSGKPSKKPFQDPATNPFGFPIGSKGGIGSTSISPSISSNLAIQDTFNAVMLDALAGGSFALEAGREFTQAAILALSSARYEAAAQAYGMGGGNQTIELRVSGDGDLTSAIASSLQQQSLSTGNSTYINRRTGGFE